MLPVELLCHADSSSMPLFQCSCSNTPELTYLVVYPTVHRVNPEVGKRGGGGEIKGGENKKKRKENILELHLRLSA